MSPDDQLCGLRIAQYAGRKAGSVYPILARLEEAGWVESSWEREKRDERGPRRRFYRFSPDGLAAARALLTGNLGAARPRTAQRASVRSPNPATGFGLPGRTAR